MHNNTFLLIIGTVLLTACGGQPDESASSETPSVDRKIYIDAETGERLPGPLSSETPTPANQSTSRHREPNVVERDDGSKIIIHKPDDWPQLKAHKKSEGGLSIEHATGSE
ncbi:hypothetical protein RM531_12950 [Salinisphaera sp. P385]|uniref:Secreted protein n=1 Tax=Spectribacter acetivorans TaxID=3075603 RepID=A0ABU3BB87_9GAMM|nr:hypothetical protein [Salinisphaera sp. P385]MDT0619380.1 hypothetical protein [Salinisphaera sp. P385]